MLEKDIERAVCKYAREKGMLVYKFSSPSQVAVPDRLFITPNGKVFFIEFKSFGGKTTPAQNRQHQKMRSMGVIVHVVYDAVVGKWWIDKHLK